MIVHGTRQAGEDHPRASLTDAQVIEIRQRHAAALGANYVHQGFRTQLAYEYGVPLHVIKDLLSGRTWKPRHIPPGRREALTRPTDAPRLGVLADAPLFETVE